MKYRFKWKKIAGLGILFPSPARAAPLAPMSKAKKPSDVKRIETKDHARIRWVFRCNAAINDEPDEITDREQHAQCLLNKLESICSAAAFQLESAPTTGYLHYQGCFELTNKKRFGWIQKNIQKFEYLAPMVGTPKQAWAYSTKLETRIAGPWTWGEPYGEEVRKPTELFVNAIILGDDDRSLVQEHPSCFLRHDADKVRMAMKMKPDRMKLYGDKDIEVYLFYGAPGTGKSYAARELYPDIYDVPPQNKGSFFISQDGSAAEVVLIEDFDGNMPLKDFNRYIDPYVMRVHVKGKFGWWCPRIVIITSNTLPSQWYNYDHRQDVYAQVKRRIDKCFDFNTPEGKAMTKGLTVDELEAKYKPAVPLLQQMANARMAHLPPVVVRSHGGPMRSAWMTRQAARKTYEDRTGFTMEGSPVRSPSPKGDKIQWDDFGEKQPVDELMNEETIPKRWF